ncbi:MAG: hypothetical protein Q4Q22_07690 [Methanosphaera sp.]|nr:hypothetical protein [Methanosphaera sp.]
MYEKIFGNYPQVKVINYILINPKRDYTKKQIAVGAKISRVTLDSFITDLIKLNIIEKENSKYRLNLNSRIVKILIDAQVNIAELIMKNQIEKSEIILGEALSDEEFEEFMNSDIDEEIDKLENNEHISITREEYETLKNKQQSINSSENLCTDFIINGCYPVKSNKRMINYG